MWAWKLMVAILFIDKVACWLFFWFTKQGAQLNKRFNEMLDEDEKQTRN